MLPDSSKPVSDKTRTVHYDPDTGEIVAYVWGKRNLKTARELRTKLDELGVDFGYICCDNWDSFLTQYSANNQETA